MGGWLGRPSPWCQRCGGLFTASRGVWVWDCHHTGRWVSPMEPPVPPWACGHWCVHPGTTTSGLVATHGRCARTHPGFKSMPGLGRPLPGPHAHGPCRGRLSSWRERKGGTCGRGGGAGYGWSGPEVVGLARVRARPLVKWSTWAGSSHSYIRPHSRDWSCPPSSPPPARPPPTSCPPLHTHTYAHGCVHIYTHTNNTIQPYATQTRGRIWTHTHIHTPMKTVGVCGLEVPPGCLTWAGVEQPGHGSRGSRIRQHERTPSQGTHSCRVL